MDEITKIEEVDTLSNIFTIEEEVKNYTLLEKLNLIFDYVKKLQFEIQGTQIFNTLNEKIFTAKFTGHNGINVDMSEDSNEVFDIRLDEDITRAIEELHTSVENGKVDIENITEILGEITPKVARALLTPISPPAETKLVAVDNTNSQEMVGIGEDLTLENSVIKIAQSLYDKINVVSQKPKLTKVSVAVPSNGSYYTPTKDGWLLLKGTAQSGGYVELGTWASNGLELRNTSASGGSISVYLPVRKGDKCYSYYSGVGSLEMYFIENEEV